MSTHTCVNCQNVFEGQYCPECGQKAGVKTDSYKFLTDSISNVFDLDRGVIVTCIHLFTKPSTVIDHLQKGNTVKYTNPVRLVLILITVYTFFGFFLSKYFSAREETFLEFQTYIDAVASIVAVWISNFLINKKYTSFIGHGMIAVYQCCQILLLTILFSFFLYLFGVKQIALFELIFIILSPGYSIWFSIKVYKLRWYRVLLLALSICIVFVSTKAAVALLFNV